ncbi:hypothetical protein ACFY4C_41575 [Actinomadura viridis]|uniref:hypothetical protein n=1 Tax=Actinomadura viridis TaxID=58110 RepID=UPI0036BD8FAF
MSEVSQQQVDEWVKAIETLRENTAARPEDSRKAYEAAANLWSAYGYNDAPEPVIEMLCNAIETGYAQALKDLRDGKLDNEVSNWRSDLFDE